VAGGSGDDVLLDLGGNNRLLGEVGNDVIISAASCFFEPLDNVSECVPSGDDTITGGSGDDAILDFGGNNRMTGEAGEDFIGVAASDSVNHSLVVGGSGDDLIDTEGGNNMLQGEAGNDLLEADDTLSNLDGGAGVDSCAGGARQIRCNP
jgi:Ca2+-binding RTX toxin-like protein